MLLQCPFCGVQHAKPSGTPRGTEPTLRSPERSRHLMKAVSAAAAGAQAPLAAVAGGAEEPRGGGAAGLSPGAEAVTRLPAMPPSYIRRILRYMCLLI